MPDPDYRRVLKFMNTVRDELGEDAYRILNHHVMMEEEHPSATTSASNSSVKLSYFHSTQIMEEIVDVLRTHTSLLLQFNTLFMEEQIMPLQILYEAQNNHDDDLILIDNNNLNNNNLNNNPITPIQNIVVKWDKDVYLYLGEAGKKRNNNNQNHNDNNDHHNHDDNDTEAAEQECPKLELEEEEKNEIGADGYIYNNNNNNNNNKGNNNNNNKQQSQKDALNTINNQIILTSKLQFSFARSLYKDYQILPDDKETLVTSIIEAPDRDAITYPQVVQAAQILQNKRDYIVAIRKFLPPHRTLKIWTTTEPVYENNNNNNNNNNNSKRKKQQQQPNNNDDNNNTHNNTHDDEHIFIRMDEPTTGYSVYFQDLGHPVDLIPEQAFALPKLPRPVLRLDIRCHKCGKRFQKHQHSEDIYPIPSMVCEHSICHPCWFKAIEQKTSRGPWLNCPMVECNSKKAFHTEKKYPNMLAMETMVKLKEAETEIQFFDNKCNAVRLPQYNEGDPFQNVQAD